MLRRSLISILIAVCLLIGTPVLAAELRLSDVALAPCDANDPGAQPGQALGNTRNNTQVQRALAATC